MANKINFRKEVCVINSLLKEADGMIAAASKFLDGELQSQVTKDLGNKRFARLVGKPYFSAIDLSVSEGEKLFKGRTDSERLFARFESFSEGEGKG